MTISVSTAIGGQYEVVFIELGIPFEFVPDLPLDAPQTVHAIQVRSQRIAPPERVNRYAEQDAKGADFPPITIRSGDNGLIDGSTRILAKKRNGRTTIPAYIVSPRNDAQALELGGALNQLGGKDLEPEELRRVALVASEHLSTRAVSKMFGVSEAKVASWKAQDAAAQHASRVGLNSDDFRTDLSGRQQELVAKVVNDLAFTKLVDVMKTTEPVAAELNAVVKTVIEAPSEEAAVDAIAAAATAWPAKNGSRSSSRAPAMSAPMHIGALVKYPPDHWVDVHHRAKLEPMWQQISELATGVLAGFRSGT